MREAGALRYGRVGISSAARRGMDCRATTARKPPDGGWPVPYLQAFRHLCEAMMKALRKLLVRTLGFERYIRFVSGVYLRLVRGGWGRQKYPELFFLEQIIQPGFVCLDIGANLGYYSVALSRLAGPEGQVLAVEPIPDFQ